MNLYWWLVLANLAEFFTVISVLGLFGAFFALLICDFDVEENKTMMRWAIAFVVMLAILGLLACLIPSRKDLAIMYGWDAINSDTVKDVVENLTKRIT